MTCGEFKDRLDPWVRGLMEGSEREAAERHLAACPACAAMAAGARLDHGDLDVLFARERAGRDRILAAALPGAWRIPRWGWALAASALLAAGLWTLRGDPPPPEPPPVPVAALERATGPLEVGKGGSWRGVPAGGALRVLPGERVRAPQGSAAAFRCGDGTRICLNASSEVLFLDTRHLEVAQGEVWTLVASFDRPMRIVVEAGAVTPLGCILDVAVAAGESRLATLSGTALFSDRHGGRRTVATGQACAIRGGRIGALEEAPPGEALAWLGPLQVLPPRKGRKAAGPDPADPESLLRHLESGDSRQDPGFRRDCARGLAALAERRHLGGLVGLLSDGDGEVRCSSAAALGRLAGRDGPPSIAPEAWKTLEGEALDRACESWQRWWEDRR